MIRYQKYLLGSTSKPPRYVINRNGKRIHAKGCQLGNSQNQYDFKRDTLDLFNFVKSEKARYHSRSRLRLLFKLNG
jgi:hypothetical protein